MNPFEKHPQPHLNHQGYTQSHRPSLRSELQLRQHETIYKHSSALSAFPEQIAVSHDGQIQYLPVTTEQQVVNPEDLEAVAHSAVTGGLFYLQIVCRLFS